MKLFFIVFAAILAAGAILLASVYGKARLDEWERAKWIYATQAATASAVAQVPPLFSSDTSKALLRHTAIDRDREYVRVLENKPFGFPLTAVEQRHLKIVRADIAKFTDQTDNEKPIPPDSSQTESPVVDVPATAPAPTLMITLNQPVPIQTESGTVTLPVGTKVQFVSQINTKVQIDATDLKRKR